MSEPMPHARIDAVENSAVVLVCMSHKYKQGQTNRTGITILADSSVSKLSILNVYALEDSVRFLLRGPPWDIGGGGWC